MSALASSTMGFSRRLSPRWLMLGLLVLFPIAGRLADSYDITSVGITGAALRAAAPILLAGLGGLWAERSGTLNLGLDGMMTIGTFTGAWSGLHWGPWVALIGGVVGGALCGLLHAVMTLMWGVDQAIAGIVINMAAVGVVRFLASLTFAHMPDRGGSIGQSPTLDPIPTFSIPGAHAVLDPVGTQGIPIVSAIARMLEGLLVNLSWGTLIALLLVPITWWVFARTRFGLHLRACGENPSAADSLGVSPYKIRYWAQIISGGLAGLGGAYLTVVSSQVYRENQVNGRGFIGLATVLFGNWTPGGVTSGSLLFGFTDALTTRPDAAAAEALLLIGAVALLARTLFLIRSGRRNELAWNAVIGAIALIWFIWSTSVPPEFIIYAPYLTTLVVLVVAQQTLRPPSAVGVPYRRSEE